MARGRRGYGFWWYLHRVLCRMGLHAAERYWAWKGPNDTEDWAPAGWLCGVCSKHWKEKEKR